MIDALGLRASILLLQGSSRRSDDWLWPNNVLQARYLLRDSQTNELIEREPLSLGDLDSLTAGRKRQAQRKADWTAIIFIH